MEEDIIEYASDGSQCVQECYQNEKKIRACSDSGKLHFFLFSFPQNSKDNWSHAVPSCPCVSCLIKSTKQRCHQWVSGQIVCTLNLVYCESRCHVHYWFIVCWATLSIRSIVRLWVIVGVCSGVSGRGYSSHSKWRDSKWLREKLKWRPTRKKVSTKNVY